MRYTSTRNSALSVSFEEALSTGYAPDGGLFVPESLPPITSSDLEEWAALTYPQLARRILRIFVSEEELSDVTLDKICKDAYYGFEDPDHAVPIRKLGSVFLAELFEGPTFCFKDLGMRAVVALLSEFARKRKCPTTLLVSTTGDTGPAAVQAVSDMENPYLKILVHYPKGQISNFQRKQLTTLQSECVRVVAFEGGGDDMDIPIKRISTSQKRGENPSSRLCGVNSYNIGRPLMQMVHYIWTYLRVMEKLSLKPCAENKLDIVLPTGAMGNIASGYMAKKMGLPLGKLCAGVNVNDITHRTFQNGTFHKSPEVLRTLSEAINIQVPYNFERLLYYLIDQKSSIVKEFYAVMDATQKNDLESEWLAKMQTEFDSARIDDEYMCKVLKQVYETYGYVCDPHSAVALGAAESLGYFSSTSGGDVIKNITPVAVLLTASPCKFQESVTVALGEEVWQLYEQNDFPARAKVVLEKEEAAPIIYKFEEGKTLSEVQVEWEAQARALITELQVV